MREIYGRCIGDLWQTSHALSSLHIMGFRENYRRCYYLSVQFYTYSKLNITFLILYIYSPKTKECLLSVILKPIIPLLQCLERGEGGFPLPPKQALEQMIESPPKDKGQKTPLSGGVRGGLLFTIPARVSAILPYEGLWQWCPGRRGKGRQIISLLWQDLLP